MALQQFNEGGRYTCGGCGRTFSSLGNFDAHHRSIPVAPYVECLDPAAVTKEDGSPRFRLVSGVWKSAEINPRWS